MLDFHTIISLESAQNEKWLYKWQWHKNCSAFNIRGKLYCIWVHSSGIAWPTRI